MSTTTLIAWEKTGSFHDLREYQNSHLLHPMIWDHLVNRYGAMHSGDRNALVAWVYKDGFPMFGDSGPLWALVKNPKVAFHHRAALALTFDNAVIPLESIPRLVTPLRHFALEMLQGTRLAELADDLHRLADGQGFWTTDGIAPAAVPKDHEFTHFGIIGTSVASDHWMVYTPADDEDEDGEERGFDLSIDTNWRTWESICMLPPKEGAPA